MSGRFYIISLVGSGLCFRMTSQGDAHSPRVTFGARWAPSLADGGRVGRRHHVVFSVRVPPDRRSWPLTINHSLNPSLNTLSKIKAVFCLSASWFWRRSSGAFCHVSLVWDFFSLNKQKKVFLLNLVCSRFTYIGIGRLLCRQFYIVTQQEVYVFALLNALRIDVSTIYSES